MCSSAPTGSFRKTMQFRNLGLVIIDEEQWFGVKHKERLKQLRTQVDVLTLTATPIPRTLQMTMTSVRDLSIINTPPSGRLAIRTQVLRFSEKPFAKRFSASSAAAGKPTSCITAWKPWNEWAHGSRNWFRKRASSWHMARWIPNRWKPSC